MATNTEETNRETYVTYKSIVIVSFTNLLVILSFVVTLMIGYRASIERELTDREGEVDQRLNDMSTDIDYLQVILMEKAILSGENDETGEQDTTYLCVDIPDPIVNFGRIDTRKEIGPIR